MSTGDQQRVWAFRTNSLMALVDAGKFLEIPIYIWGHRSKTEPLSRSRRRPRHGVVITENQNLERSLELDVSIEGTASLRNLIMQEGFDDLVIEGIRIQLKKEQYDIIITANTLQGRPPTDKWRLAIKDWEHNRKPLLRGFKLVSLDVLEIRPLDKAKKFISLKKLKQYITKTQKKGTDEYLIPWHEVTNLKDIYGGKLRTDILKGVNSWVCTGIQ